MRTNKGLHEGLLKVAGDLLDVNSRRPNEAHLRRAVSSVYYALFHFLAQLCADSFIGTQGTRNRSKPAWQHVYRSLDHGAAKTACEAAKNKNFPQEIKSFSALFVEYQLKRHDADYNPYANTSGGDFTKENIFDMIQRAKSTIADLRNTPPNDCKAFSAFVLLKPPRK